MKCYTILIALIAQLVEQQFPTHVVGSSLAWDRIIFLTWESFPKSVCKEVEVRVFSLVSMYVISNSLKIIHTYSLLDVHNTTFMHSFAYGLLYIQVCKTW